MNRNTFNYLKSLQHFTWMFLLLFITTAPFIAAAQSAPPSTTKSLPTVGTSTIAGTIQGLSIEAMVQSPSAETTPLQIICVFEYTEGDITTAPPALPAPVNGLFHINQALHGLFTELRKSGRFAGHALETLLITPPKGTIAAKKLLLIGLGNRNQFTPDIMTRVGSIGMREALRLGVNSYAHASDLKDAGIDSPTALVAGNVLRGAVAAYRTELYLKANHLSTAKPMVKVTLLAGPAFFEPSLAALKETIQALNNEPQ